MYQDKSNPCMDPTRNLKNAQGLVSIVEQLRWEVFHVYLIRRPQEERGEIKH